MDDQRRDASAEGRGRILPLSEMDDYEVAAGDPDVRGWDVIAGDGRRIGEVHELLVDTSARRVRYLDVELDRGLEAAAGGRAGERGLTGDYDQMPGEFNRTEGPPGGELAGTGLAGVVQGVPTGGVQPLEGHGARGRHVLVPIGNARIDTDEDRVHVDRLQSRDAHRLPEYAHGAITRELESSLPGLFEREPGGAGGTGVTGAAAYAGPGAGQDFYASSLYDEDRFYAGRRTSRVGLASGIGLTSGRGGGAGMAPAGSGSTAGEMAPRDRAGDEETVGAGNVRGERGSGHRRDDLDRRGDR